VGLAQTKNDPTRTNILGSYISVWDQCETVAKLSEMARDVKRKHYVCVSNVHTVVMGMSDPAFTAVTNQATLATADGVPLVWASQVLGGQKIHGRASGPDILSQILVDPCGKGLKHYFYGSTDAVLGRLQNQLSTLPLSGEISGFFSPPLRSAKGPQEPLDADELKDCELLNQSGADIIWVGLGAPKQEVWMYRARPHLKAAVLIGVGAAFDFLAGNKKRAPEWMQKSGLEWAYRLMQEPDRLASRYLKTNPIFVAAVLKQALSNRRGSIEQR